MVTCNFRKGGAVVAETAVLTAFAAFTMLTSPLLIQSKEGAQAGERAHERSGKKTKTVPSANRTNPKTLTAVADSSRKDALTDWNKEDLLRGYLYCFSSEQTLDDFKRWLERMELPEPTPNDMANIMSIKDVDKPLSLILGGSSCFVTGSWDFRHKVRMVSIYVKDTRRKVGVESRFRPWNPFEIDTSLPEHSHILEFRSPSFGEVKADTTKDGKPIDLKHIFFKRLVGDVDDAAKDSNQVKRK